LLSSDVKGYISNPCWYFESNDELHRASLDLLMLTQGWRRYKWERSEGLESFQAREPIEEGLLVDGSVRSILWRKPVPDVDLTMWITRGGYSHHGSIRTDSTGRFAFLLPDVFEDWNLSLHTLLKDKTKDFRILLNRQFSPSPRPFMGYDKDVWLKSPLKSVSSGGSSSSGISTGADESSLLEPSPKLAGIKEYRLKEVVKTAKRPVPLREELFRTALINIDMNREVDKMRDQGKAEATDILKYLESILDKFTVTESVKELGSEMDKRLVVVKKAHYRGREVGFACIDANNPNKILDDHIYNILSEDNDLVVSDIDHVLVSDRTPSGQLNAGKIVCIYLFLKKDFSRDPLGTRTSLFQGYSLSKDFYSPVYQTGSPVMESDYRRTLYWNPEIILDKSGKASVEFYNNETCKQMDVSAEGITSNGVLLQNK
jgi:hypothetical protein